MSQPYSGAPRANDFALLERWIRVRDASALSEIVTRYADLVYSACRRVVGNEPDARDAAQDCFLRLAGIRERPPVSLAAWLHTVATRRSIDVLRSRARRREREEHFARRQAARREHDVPADERAAWEELQHQVDACIAELPKELRTVLVAHFLERKTQSAIATELGVSRQTVTHRVGQGVERLRAALASRGVVASAVLVSSFLGGLVGEAAPPALLASLGRLALLGQVPGSTATSTTGVSTTSSTSTSVSLSVGGIIMTKKVVISAAAAALFLSFGFVALLQLASPDRTGVETVRDEALHTTSSEPHREAEASSTSDRSTRAPESRTPPDRGPQTARVSPGTAITGRVVDAGGSAVSGASVLLTAESDGKIAKIGASASDDRGEFSMRLDETGATPLALWAFERTAGLGATGLGDGALEVVLEPLASVSGRVTDAATGDGIAGMALRLARQRTSGTSPELEAFHEEADALFPELGVEPRVATTDEKGRYEFLWIDSRARVFLFDPSRSEHVVPGFRRDDTQPTLQLEPGERRDDVDFALDRGGTIAGAVRAPEGISLVDARVELVSPFHWPRRRVLDCEPGGEFRFLGVATNTTFVVRATAAGLPVAESRPVPMAEPTVVEDVVIQMVGGRTVAGRFLDDSGRPIAELDVGLTRASRLDSKTLYCGQVKTDSGGSFLFEPVASGRHLLQPVSKDYLSDRPIEVDVPADRDLLDLEFVLRRKALAFIAGRVVDSRGGPVADLPIVAKSGSKVVSLGKSDATGAFRIDDLEEGKRYTVVSHTPGRWCRRLTAVPTFTSDVLLVSLERGQIGGRVVDGATGGPVETFEVRAEFIRVEEKGENRFSLKWKMFESETGEFLIEGAEPTDVELHVRAPGYTELTSPRYVVPEGGSPPGIVLALERGAAIRGRVVDAETRKPLGGVKLHLHDRDTFNPGMLEERSTWRRRWKLEMSRADGSFEFGGVDPGTRVHLVAWKDGHGTLVRRNLTAGLDAAGIELVMERAATLKVGLELPAGSGRTVHVVAHHRAEKPWHSAFYARASTAKSGPLELGNLPPGPYYVAVLPADAPSGSEEGQVLYENEIQLAAGEVQTLRVEVSP